MKSVKRIQYALGSIFLTFILGLFLTSGLYAESEPSQGTGSSLPPPPPSQDAQSVSQNQTGRQREMRAPPQAAIDACSGKAEGSVCQCQGPQGVESGVCVYTPDKKYFACRPNHPPQDTNDNNRKSNRPSAGNESSPPQ